MTLSVVYTEATTLLRDWLRGVVAVTALAGARTYAGGLPDGVTLPAATIRRIGGAPDGPVDLGLYQIDCWAATAPAAATLAAAFASTVESVGVVDLGSNVSLVGGVVQSWNVLDTDSPDYYRHTLTVQLPTRTSTP